MAAEANNKSSDPCPWCGKPLGRGVTRCWNKGCGYVINPTLREIFESTQTLLDSAISLARAGQLDSARSRFDQALQRAQGIPDMGELSKNASEFKDRALMATAQAQAKAGFSHEARSTASLIQDDEARFRALSDIFEEESKAMQNTDPTKSPWDILDALVTPEGTEPGSAGSQKKVKVPKKKVPAQPATASTVGPQERADPPPSTENKAAFELGADVQKLREAIDTATADYMNSSTVTQTRMGCGGAVSLDIKDILLVGALSGVDSLLTGRTGAGKTHLAKMVMTALFGRNGYFGKTVTPGMSTSDFLDIDFGAIQRDGKSLREAMRAVEMTKRPGVILNEPNRAPELVQAILIPFFDHEFEAEGSQIELGVQVPDTGLRYQYRILTINEGAEYSGVVGLDRAVRDRMVIEVPMDHLTMSSGDVLRMFEKRTSAKMSDQAGEGMLEELLAIHKLVLTLPLSQDARGLLVYLNGLGNCIRSLNGSKNGIAFTPAICGQGGSTGGCHHFAPMGGVCGAVFKPSARALLNLQSVARGIAAVRLAHAARMQTEGSFSETMEVTDMDVLAAAPLVLFSKLEIDPAWIAKRYQGNKWAAIKSVMSEVLARVILARKELLPTRQCREMNATQRKKLLQDWVVKNDAWLATWQEAGFTNPLR
jgi:hypothetical protein